MLIQMIRFLLQAILFVDSTIVGWYPISKIWLENKTDQEVHVRLILKNPNSIVNETLLN